MSKLSQTEAVYQAVKNVTGHTGESAVEISKEQRAQVNAILFEGFRNNQIVLSREYNDTDLKSYVSGLQSNWLRKDPRLNGGVKYVAKNPGSRQGQGDPELKALKALITTVETDEDREEIQGYIDAKMEAIAATKQVKAVDFSALPAELALKFKKS